MSTVDIGELRTLEKFYRRSRMVGNLPGYEVNRLLRATKKTDYRTVCVAGADNCREAAKYKQQQRV